MSEKFTVWESCRGNSSEETYSQEQCLQSGAGAGPGPSSRRGSPQMLTAGRVKAVTCLCWAQGAGINDKRGVTSEEQAGTNHRVNNSGTNVIVPVLLDINGLQSLPKLAISSWKVPCHITAEWWLISAPYVAGTTDGSLPQDDVFKDAYAISETNVRKSWPLFTHISRDHHSSLVEKASNSVSTGFKQYYPATPLNANRHLKDLKIYLYIEKQFFHCKILHAE